MNYTVKRSKRKTMTLKVTGTGEILVAAPFGVSDREIASFVERHRAWIGKRLGQVTAVPAFFDGERVEILGRPRLIQTGRAALLPETLLLPAAGREKALVKILRDLTAARMSQMLGRVCEHAGFTYTKFAVTSARTRWGSCSSRGHISFTFRTAFLPDELALYLCVHELCHTRYLNHGREFWHLVGNLLPDYAKRRAALKKYAWAMECLR